MPPHPRSPSARGAADLTSVFVDLSPLRASRDFRTLWAGLLVSTTGRQLTYVAVPYQVYVATHNNLAVGLLGLVQAVPLVAAGLYAGAAADRFDRRKVILAALCAQLLASLALLSLAVRGSPPIAALYAITAAAAAFVTLEQASRSASIPRLVGSARLAPALALFQLLVQFALVVGPAVAGLVIGALGLTWAYGIDAACYAVALLLVGRMAAQPALEGHTVQLGLRAPVEGLAFAWRRPVILACFGIDLNAMVFGMPRALFPALATGIFQVGAQGMGMLYAAPAGGALVTSVLSGWVGRARRQGRLVIVAVTIWGAAIAVFGLTRNFALALLCLAVAGAADMISAVFRNAILQLATPDRLRGRMSALHSMVVTSGPRLGDLEAGAVATLVNPVFSVVSGGVACVAGALLIAALVPPLRDSAAELADHRQVVDGG